MHKTIYILSLCFLLVIGSVIVSYADIGYNETLISTYTYSDNYNVTVETEDNIHFDDTGGGMQIFPSLRFGVQNSVVNALYSGGNLQLRKATQCVSSNIISDVGGRASFYTEYTNITGVTGYSVKVTIPSFTLGDISEIDDLYFYLSVNGEVQECYFSFQMLALDYNDGQTAISVSEPIEGEINTLVGTTGGNLITGDLDAYIHNLIPDQYISANALGDWFIYNLTVEMYVVPPISNQTVAYTIGQIYRPYPPTPPSMVVASPEKPPVVVDSNIVDWLGECVESIFNVPIFPVAGGYITIGTILWSVLGVGLVLMFIKFFAGG